MRWCCVLTVLQAIACQAIPHRGLGEEKAQARRAIDLLALETPSRTSGFPLSPQQSEHEHDRRDITEDAVAATRIVVAETRIVDSGTAFILPPPTREPETTGTVVTTLERDGHPSIVPLLTSPIPEPKTLLEAAETVTSADTMPSPSPQAVVANIFDVPIDTGPLPQTIGTRNTHPIPKQGVKSSGPSQTNKFYANFFLGGQNDPCYAIPYSLSWAKGRGVSGSWGMAISHTNASQRVFGPTNEVGAARYYINPVGIQSMIISAQELRNDTVLTTEALTQSSVKVSLSPNDRSRPAIEFPVVQGMAFVTAIYSGATPVIQTGVFFRSMVRAGKAPKRGVTKYKFTLEDGRTWLLYAYSSQGDSLDLQVLNNNLARAKGPFRGIVQVAKDPGDAEAIYDDSAGAYTTTTKLSGAVLGSSGSYTFTFVKEGMANVKGLMWALPHHVESFDGTTRTGVTKVRLETPTKSIATLVRADSWTMVEPQMPVKIGFAPWSPDRGSVQSLSAATKATLQSIAASEVSQDMQSQTNVNSTYFAGKVWLVLE